MNSTLPARLRRSTGVSIFFLVLSLTRPQPALAGDPQEGGQIWGIAVAQGRLAFIHPNLASVRGWLELHGRWRSLGESFDTGFFPRFALGYAFSDRIHLDSGFSAVQIDPAGAKPYTELRPWQQLIWNVPVTGVKLQWRTRLEQRIHQQNVGWRLREFLRTSIAVPGLDRVYLAASNELFFDLDDTTWGQRRGFRQNRFFAGPGFWLDRAGHVSVEPGYMNQWIDRRREDRVNHILSLTLSLTY